MISKYNANYTNSNYILMSCSLHVPGGGVEELMFLLEILRIDSTLIIRWWIAKVARGVPLKNNQ